MAHHEDSHDHGHDMTEGNRQYYPKGWHLPLIGLFVVAFFFALGAGALLGISGTDKWGKVEYCHDGNCDGHCGMEHMDATGHDDTHTIIPVSDSVVADDSASIKVPVSDCTMVDSAKTGKSEPVQLHEGHNH